MGFTANIANRIVVTDFGAKPDSRLNAVAAVQKALAACRGLDHPILVFPKGRYDFWPQYAVEKDYFESNRARGLLVSTPGRVRIENNRFASSGSAILIAGDANSWFESGAVRDVTIRGNVFGPPCLSSTYQFGEGIISIFPMIPKPDPAFPYHRNIRIEGNEFHPFDYPVLYALSVEGLVFSGNTITRSDYAAPHHSRKATVTLEFCRGVRIEANRFVGDVLGKNIVLKGTAPSDVTIGPGQGWIR